MNTEWSSLVLSGAGILLRASAEKRGRVSVWQRVDQWHPVDGFAACSPMALLT
jgi:hypothetical protein